MHISVPETFAIVVGTYGAVLSTYNAITQRRQQQRERQKSMVQPHRSGKGLVVQWAAVRKDANGYHIPGEGKLEVHDNLLVDIKNARGKLALHCENASGIGDVVPIYRVLRIMPL